MIRRDEDEQADQVAEVHAEPAGEDGVDEELRQREQPPLHQDQAVGQPLRVLDIELSRVARVAVEANRRVAVGAERAASSPREPKAIRGRLPVRDTEGWDRTGEPTATAATGSLSAAGIGKFFTTAGLPDGAGWYQHRARPTPSP